MNPTRSNLIDHTPVSDPSTMQTTPLLAVSQLGYRPESPKTISLSNRDADGHCLGGLPDRIPFIVRTFGGRTQREPYGPGAEHWTGNRFCWPYFLDRGPFRPRPDSFVYQGELQPHDSAWGTFWQADLGDFKQPGVWQIETQYATSQPFKIDPDLYDRLTWGFLQFIKSRRCSCDQPGIGAAEHLDDAVLDSTGEYICTTGGWYDAGDVRKWMSQTQFIISGLAEVHRHGPAAFRPAIEEEIAWGNKYFHTMINHEGRVYEDVAGGDVPNGFDIETRWWFENHPGCIADGADDRFTDNVRHSGDERRIRDRYNPWTQFAFVRTQCDAADVMPAVDARRCLYLAERAYHYAQGHGHDGRTLFVCAEIAAGQALLDAGSSVVDLESLRSQVQELLGRQERSTGNLRGYFLEADAADAFRSVAYAAEPALTLLGLLGSEEARQRLGDRTIEPCRDALKMYFDEYLLADMRTNLFSLCPYGVYIDPPRRDQQSYRDAGQGRGIRNFIHPFNEQQIAHGTLSVVMHQAYALTWAGQLLDHLDYHVAAEKLLQWACGHNPASMCQFMGLGTRCPVPFSSYHYQIPECCVTGFNGHPDDRPHIVETAASDWTTQEVWTVPYTHAVRAVSMLGVGLGR